MGRSSIWIGSESQSTRRTGTPHARHGADRHGSLRCGEIRLRDGSPHWPRRLSSRLHGGAEQPFRRRGACLYAPHSGARSPGHRSRNRRVGPNARRRNRAAARRCRRRGAALRRCPCPRRERRVPQSRLCRFSARRQSSARGACAGGIRNNNDTLLLRRLLAEQRLPISARRSTSIATKWRHDSMRHGGAAIACIVAKKHGSDWRPRTTAAALSRLPGNWNVQREPADLRILVDAARATNDAATLRLLATGSGRRISMTRRSLPHCAASDDPRADTDLRVAARRPVRLRTSRGDAYLTVERNGASLEGQWDIALRDLDNAIGLDTNGDGEITWAELRHTTPTSTRTRLAELRIASSARRAP